MTTLDTNTTIGQFVTDRPARSRVFERLGIDYCCGGRLTLADACAKRGLDPAAVIEELRASDASASPSRDPDWSRATMTELADHIEAAHHDYLKRELPRLVAMGRKVAGVHGDRHAELPALAEVLEGFARELFSHMQKEEQVLFPALRAFEGEGTFHGPPTLDGPIAVMIAEHDDAGRALETMRRLTNGYAPPEDACNTFRAFYDGLAQLEADMHQHVHKENNILFPMALAAKSAGGSCGCCGGGSPCR